VSTPTENHTFDALLSPLHHRLSSRSFACQRTPFCEFLRLIPSHILTPRDTSFCPFASPWPTTKRIVPSDASIPLPPLISSPLQPHLFSHVRTNLTSLQLHPPNLHPPRVITRLHIHSPQWTPLQANQTPYSYTHRSSISRILIYARMVLLTLLWL
jgi:hypothetical protein